MPGVSLNRATMSGACLPVLERPVRPDMDLADLADRTRAYDFRTAPEPIFGCPLIAHLGADALLLGPSRA